ncbi:hypothetical protein BIFGAL_04269 [Bifidobacterium gallicum DSM 20093 = LMG 11596]|uniref:Uncharacterized protein n=1 Tax=Bifidobacterium gallicum DSM 20093 = LMG 11596 TaxID=561180 RepID=D1NWL5_9BIFI|nr:hypothetical protein BIFGAL_04269 [Bifidobacterium gallicum DSM 20093 = LMG 11596]
MRTLAIDFSIVQIAASYGSDQANLVKYETARDVSACRIPTMSITQAIRHVAAIICSIAHKMDGC